MSKLQGIFVPHIVPYHENGKINEGELRRIIRWLGEKGVSGFYPNGSMGEFIRLSYEERKRVVRIVSEEGGGGRARFTDAVSEIVREVLRKLSTQ